MFHMLGSMSYKKRDKNKTCISKVPDGLQTISHLRFCLCLLTVPRGREGTASA